MILRYKTYFFSILTIYSITCFFLSIQSFTFFDMSNKLSQLVETYSTEALINCFTLFFSYFTLLNFINVSFLVSLLSLCYFGFVWLSDQGAYYTIQYAWQKHKHIALFFLPKYWGRSQSNSNNKEEEVDLETGQKIYHTFESFVAYKQSKRWQSINQLFAASVTVFVLSFMLTLFI